LLLALLSLAANIFFLFFFFSIELSHTVYKSFFSLFLFFFHFFNIKYLLILSDIIYTFDIHLTHISIFNIVYFWLNILAATRSLTDLKIVHSGASTAGSLPAGAVVKEWTVNDAASEGPYLQMYRGTGAYDTKTLKFYDDANVAKSFFGDYSVAHVDCGLMPCPTSNLQICSRIICPSGTKLDDSGNCVLCPTSAAGNTFSTRTMNPFQGAYYTVDTVACDACADYGMNNEGEVRC
jgi:hypothetical protein